MTSPSRGVLRGPALDPTIAELTGETLVELLDRAVSRTPDSIALVIDRDVASERWTYRQLRERSMSVAVTLRARGVGAGDRVLTWSRNDPWLVATYFALWRLGAIIVPLDLRMETDVALRIGRRAQASLLIADPDVDAAALEALGLPVVTVEATGLERLDPPPAPHDRSGSPQPAVSPATIAEILFTSGTTSDPKGVVLTHEQIVHSARAIAQVGRGRASERALGIIPLSHMYGQSVPLLLSLITGSRLVFLQTLTPNAIRTTMQRERITAVTLVPQLLEIIMDGIESEARRGGRERRLARARRIARWLPRPARRLLFRSVLKPLGGSLQVISCGGARLPEELQAAWEIMGITVVQGYGTTECAAVCGHSRKRQRPGTVGPPLAGLEVSIASDGELLVRGPNVMSGYWRDPAATAAVLDADGWFHTGDAATTDSNGEVVVLGRTRDRIALPNGLNVDPEDLEGALRATGIVRAAVAFEATPGRIAAAIVPREAHIDDAALADAVRRANATLAPHQRIRAWRRWPEDEFPRTHTLKIRRTPVAAWYSETDEGSATARHQGGDRAQVRPIASAVGSDMMATIIEIVSAVVEESHGSDASTITAATTIGSLELDSLAAVSLALRLDEAFDAPLSDDEVAGATDVAGLAELVTSRRGQQPPPPPSRRAFSPAARALRRVLDRTVAGWAIQLVARPSIEGLEHLDGLGGPVLVCANHTSHLDAPLVRAALPEHLRDRMAIAAAADYWFEGNVLGTPVSLAFGAIPFGRTSDVRASMERVADLVADGFSVIIFPEGRRSSDGRLGQMRDGIGLLATRLRVPVVPAHLSGAHEILPKGATLPRRVGEGGVTVRFGAPLEFGPTVDSASATAAIGRAIAALGADASLDAPGTPL